MIVIFYCFALLLPSNNYAQKERQSWKNLFEFGSFDSLEKELDSIIQTNHPEKHDALKILGDLYKVRGDVETAHFYWKQSDSILNTINPGLNSKAIELVHLSNFYYEKFNPEMTKLYNDSLIVVVSKLKNITREDCWIWNEIAQSNKLSLSEGNAKRLLNKYEQNVFPFYEKNIVNYKSNNDFHFELARTYHLYANAHVDLVHAFNSDLTNRGMIIRLENKANLLYNKAIAIYTKMFGPDHYEIARVGYVKALLYQYAHPEPNAFEFEKTIDLFEAALAVFDINNTKDIVNIGEALGCTKQYHRSLYQKYRLNNDKVLKYKQDSIFKLSKKLWVEGITLFKSKNPNQLISLYGLSPFAERIYQIYHEYKIMGIVELNDVFHCVQQLKYQDKKQWDTTGTTGNKNLDDVQHQLKENQCYLEFLSVPKPLVLFISREEIKLHELDVRKLDIDLFSDAIKSRGFNKFVGSSLKLKELLFKTVTLSKCKELFINASGWFTQVPFQALLVSDENRNNKDYRKLDYLVKHVDIQYLFNASDLDSYNSPRSWDIDLFVPKYIEAMDLPFAERFAQEFQFESQLFDGLKAESALFENSSASILHYSGHGEGSDFRREAARLTFSDKSIGVKDIYASNNRSHIVVLNACSSGKGVFNDGDGVDGFSRAFYMKGSQQTLSTFWNLDDRSSHQILENFYLKLSQGFGSNRSLRESQINYILSAKNSSQAAPYYWAGHQMNGSTQRFEPNQSGRGGDGAIFWMALLCIGGLGYFISFRIR